MSTPQNPLARFRSYSYYHVLVVCDSSQTADVISSTSDPNVWLHPSAPDPKVVDPRDDTFSLLGGHAVKYINLNQSRENDSSTLTGKYCVLINGSTDATFNVTKVQWQTATAAQATVLDQTTSIAMEGSLEVLEPKGVVFFDVIVNCCIALGIDAAQAVFVLKTFFVGYDDTVEGVSVHPHTIINDIEPIRFIVYDMSGNFTESGGTYTINFVALSNGVARLPQYSKSASGFSITAGATLKDTLARLQDRIRSNYDTLYACVQKTISTDQREDVRKFTDSLSRVEYTIELDPFYQTSEYTVTDQQPQAKDYGDSASSPAKLTFPANMSIEDAIHTVMRRSAKVQADMVTGVDVGSNGQRARYEYKIHSTYESLKTDTGRIEHRVRYTVKPFMRPKDINLIEFASGPNSDDVTELRNNTIEFDYLYTGKNIDILEFEMRMNLGMQYLQIATITNTLKDQLQTAPSSMKHVMRYDLERLSRFGESKVTQVPVLFGSQVQVPSLRNKPSLAESTEAGYSMNKHASIEVQDAQVRIMGNPSLLNAVNRAAATAPLPATNQVLSSWGLLPAFSKINIRMPRNNDDIALFSQNISDARMDEVGYTKEFWFTGYYYIVGINHIFEDGGFYQVLELIGIPQSNATKVVSANGQTQGDLTRQQQIYECFDHTIDPCKCNQSSGTSASSQQAVPSTPPNDLTHRDSVSVYDNRIDPEMVSGYRNATPTVKTAINAAARKHGVSPGNLVAIAASESSFSSNASNSKSTASGLFQFTEETWFGYKGKPGSGIVTQYGKALGIADKSKSEQAAARTDPMVSSEAAALLYNQNVNGLKKVVGDDFNPTVYDVYLAHVLGAPVAGNVIKADREQGSASPLSDAYAAAWNSTTTGTEWLSKNKTSNPALFGDATTVGELRTRVALHLNKRLPNVTVVASQNTQTGASQTSNNASVVLASSKTAFTCDDKRAAGEKKSINETPSAT